jgi:hypothetical protein
MPIERYASNSPYSATLQTSWRIGRYVHRDIPPAEDDTLIVVESRFNHRPDLLSNELYGTPAYWWIFSVRNPEIRLDPIWALKTGTIISVPSPERLRRLLGA